MPSPSAIAWVLATERIVGRNHPSLQDVANRAARGILAASGYDPDVAEFRGLPGPEVNFASWDPPGDDTTDVTSDLNEFFLDAQAAGLRNVRIPPGLHRVSGTVTIPPADRWRIIADGAVLRPVGSFTGPVLKIGDDSGAVRTNFLYLRGLHIVNNTASAAADGVAVYELFNSTVDQVLVQDMPNDGVSLYRKGYNTRWRDCTIWLNGGIGLRDATTGPDRFVPFYWDGGRIEGNGEHGVAWLGDQFNFIAGTLQSNATLGAGFYDAYMQSGVSCFLASQFEHPNPATAGDERTMCYSEAGAVLVIVGGAFSGNRTGSLGHTALQTNGKLFLLGTMIRDLKDPWLPLVAGADAVFIPVLSNNINSPSTSGALPTNLIAMGPQIGPTFRSSFMEVQASLRNSQTSGRVKFDDSIGPQIVQNMIDGGIRKSFDGWWSDNVPAGIGPTGIARFGSGAAFPTKAFMVRPGSVVAVWVKSSEARTAGTLTVEVFKNGSTTGLTAVLDGTNTTYKLTTQGADIDTHVGGDDYDIRVTTSGDWAPTTADIRAGIEIEE